MVIKCNIKCRWSFNATHPENLDFCEPICGHFFPVEPSSVLSTNFQTIRKNGTPRDSKPRLGWFIKVRSTVLWNMVKSSGNPGNNKKNIEFLKSLKILHVKDTEGLIQQLSKVDPKVKIFVIFDNPHPF